MWPLLYCRPVALSVLWPIGEHIGGERVALRPMVSVSELDESGPGLTVLWPLGQCKKTLEATRGRRTSTSAGESCGA